MSRRDVLARAVSELKRWLEITLSGKVKSLKSRIFFSSQKENKVDTNRNFLVVSFGTEEFFRLQEMVRIKGLSNATALIREALVNLDKEVKGERLTLDITPDLREIFVEIAHELKIKAIDQDFLKDMIAFFAIFRSSGN